MKILRVAQVVMAGMILVPHGMAQAKPAGANRLTIEDVLRWRIPSNPVLSPDGKRVAFLVSESDFEKSRVVTSLWWVDTQTRQTRQLTPTGDKVSEPLWSPDGHWLAFLSARSAATSDSDTPKEKKSKTQVWILPTDGGEAFSLTKAPEGVNHYRWAVDGKAIYYVAREPLPEPAESLRQRRQKQKIDAVVVDEEKYRKEIWRVPIAERKAERIFAGDLGLTEIEPSPDGKWILYRTNYTGEPDDDRKFDLWLLDLGTRRAKQLTRRDGEEQSPAWSPDSTRVAFLAPRSPEITYSQPEVFIVSVAGEGQTPEPQRLTKNFIGNIERLRWPSRADGIYFAAAVRTGNRLFRLNPADGTVQPASAETLFLTEPDWSADGATFVAVAEGPDSLPETARWTQAAAGAEPQRLTDSNAQLKSFALGPQEVIRWKSKDGLEIEGIVNKPAGWQATQKYPLLVDIHGGPHGRRANTLFSASSAQVWAARGWLVFQPNFRGSSAYGHEFGIANRGDIGGKDYQDIVAGVDYLIAQGWADASRMAVMGGSYGGYMTNWIISQTKRFRAAVSMFGIFNLITDYSNSIYPSWEPDYLKQFYWENLPAYLDRSPFKYVAQINTPVLILHGDEDPNTFISNSKEMYQALKALGRPVKFVRLPREGHGFREPNHRIEQFQQMAAWLDQHVLGAAAAQPRGMGELVRKDPWELQVAGVRTPETYVGVKPQGRFVEVELVIRARISTEERFSMLIVDHRGSEIQLDVLDRTHYPVGVVAESLGQRILAKSSDQVVAFAPDRDGRHAAIAVAVAFDVASDAREFMLRVKDFPPVAIELPVEAK